MRADGVPVTGNGRASLSRTWCSRQTNTYMLAGDARRRKSSNRSIARLRGELRRPVESPNGKFVFATELLIEKGGHPSA